MPAGTKVILHCCVCQRMGLDGAAPSLCLTQGLFENHHPATYFARKESPDFTPWANIPSSFPRKAACARPNAMTANSHVPPYLGDAVAQGVTFPPYARSFGSAEEASILLENSKE